MKIKKREREVKGERGENHIEGWKRYYERESIVKMREKYGWGEAKENSKKE